MDNKEVRYVVEAGLDVHVVSHIQLEGDTVKLTIINPSKISTLDIPSSSITKVTKEVIEVFDVTNEFVSNEELIEA